MRVISRFGPLILSCVLAACTTRTDPLAMQIEQLVAPKVEAGRFNGVVLVADKDRVRYVQGFGFADRQSGEQMTAAHRFNIGSIGKEFSSAAIAALAMQGKLTYGDKISRHLDGLPDWASAITIANLLNYSSGISAGPPDAVWDHRITDEFLLNWLNTGEKAPSTSPGEGYLYTVYSPFLLSAVVEKVSGQPFETFVRKTLLAPAGMGDTVFEQEIAEATPRRARGFDAGGKRDYFPLKLTLPLVYTDASDLAEWARALREMKLVERDDFKQLATPQAMTLNEQGFTTQQTSFGNVRYDEGEPVALWHQGGHLNFNSVFYIDLSSGLTVIVLTNRAADDELFQVFNGVRALAAPSL